MRGDGGRNIHSEIFSPAGFSLAKKEGGERTAPEGEGEKGKKRKSFTTADMALAGGKRKRQEIGKKIGGGRGR